MRRSFIQREKWEVAEGLQTQGSCSWIEKREVIVCEREGGGGRRGTGGGYILRC